MDLKADVPARARERFEQALALARALGDRWTEGLARGSLGEALAALGRLDEARTELRASRAIARELADRQSEGAAEGDLGALYLACGATGRAREHVTRCLHIASEIGDRRGEAYAEYLRGLLGLQEGDPQHAVEHLELAREIAHSVRGRRREAWAALRLAEIAAAAGRPADARRLAQSAFSTGREVGSPSLQTIARCRLALLPGGDVGAALQALETWEAGLPLDHRIEARHLLGQVTGQPEHLRAAWRWIEILRAAAPPECRADVDAMRRHRAVRDALDGLDASDG